MAKPPPNDQAVKAQVDEALLMALELNLQRKAAIAEHVKPIDDKITKLFRKVKTDTSLHIADLKAVYRLLERQNDAKLMDDQDEGNKILANLKIIYEAVTEGDEPSLDFQNPFEDDESADGDDSGA